MLSPTGLAFDRGLGPPNFESRDCYGKGRCTGFNGNFACDCDTGFFGDCQVRRCPKGAAWWHEPVVDEIAHDEQVECSNMGRCLRETGKCQCRAGFEGVACERMSCQRDNGVSNTCAGNGRCLSLRDLASKHVNEYLESDPIVYGSIPSDPYTWDADKSQNCYGDNYGYSPVTSTSNISTYTGDRCDQRQCPYGYDSRLIDKLYAGDTIGNYTIRKEIQAIRCSATGGYFSLEFRGVKSANIYSNSSVNELKVILQSVTTLGNVELVLEIDSLSSSGDVLCSSSTSGGFNSLNVTFLSQLGLVPLFNVSSNLTGSVGSTSVSVVRVIGGTGPPLLECVGRGQCDSISGDCQCFSGYGSSDGFGKRGVHGDCGYSRIE
jgi:hypothetical protein